MNQIIHNFKESLEVGSGGERLIESFIWTLPSIKKVENVSGVEKYRAKDIDFVVTTTQDDIVTYELKTEPTAYYTGNFFYEYVCNVEKKTPGCFIFSEADYWMSFIPQSGMLYVFPLIEYREYVLESAKNFNLISVYNQGKQTRGKVLKISDVCNNIRHNVRNIRDFADYDYIEAVSRTSSSPARDSEFKNVIWKNNIPQNTDSEL